ncbi:MAG: ATP-binding cassette domain-containing protein [Lachnospiraceae bacterium]|nr:ATP-binding cassette domain-containing protein [Lachnospiraceae bacterium]
MLILKDICKTYKTGTLVTKALDNVSLSFRDNEFVAILGPSGSGKTTLLNIIGGLDRYESGELIINGVSTRKYRDRDWDSYRNKTIGFVFQSYNLIPHQSVLANVELALTISGVSRKDRKKRAINALRQVGLGDHIYKRPNQLSGGQMQRVAIARALVNDPDILLADEPTGALDSETSIQVMDLLREVAETRLVIMVTHNPELAEQYANRIVSLKDGRITGDTNPCDAGETAPPVHKNLGRARMSFFTALGLSFKNLMTKYARTILVAFAGSIGITGIALILSLSNGVNNYIDSIEQDVISEYPLLITNSSVDMTALLNSVGSDKPDGEVTERKTLTELFSKVETNDLRSLKAWFEGEEKPLEGNVRAIEYSYSITPQIFRLDRGKDGTEKYRQVNPDQTMSALGIDIGISAFMDSSMYSMDVFDVLPRERGLYEDKYEVKAGHWPETPYECVLVVSSTGRVSDLVLFALGMKDYSIFEDLVKHYMAGESAESSEEILSFNYTDFIGRCFKLLPSSSYYAYDEEYRIWTDQRENENFMLSEIRKAPTLKVVGVVQQMPGTTAMLSPGIVYPDTMIGELRKAAESSKIFKAQEASPDVDVISGNPFGTVNRGTLDFMSLFTFNEKALMDAFRFDPSKLTFDFSGLDFSGITNGFSADRLAAMAREAMDHQSFSEKEIQEFIDSLGLEQVPERARKLLSDAMQAFMAFVEENPAYSLDTLTDEDAWRAAIDAFLETEAAQELIEEFALESANAEEVTAKLSQAWGAMGNRMRAAVNEVMGQLAKSIQTTMVTEIGSAMKEAMENLATQFPDAISVDTDALKNILNFNLTQEELASLMTSLMAGAITSYDGNMRKLGWQAEDVPSHITIYPFDFDTKAAVKDAIDGYNRRMAEAEEDDKVIAYTDIVGTLMSSVETIIDVISYVLIGFVAVSLVVSSIMIGVITYISVLERRKEIGILRAIGASKFNVSEVFNAETFIIGLLSGLIGVGISLLFVMLINVILQTLVPDVYVRAVLPPDQCVILVLIAMILTIIGGLIPSRKAAKSDPVAALRSE